MKVITLTQPWATLVAIGAKKIETRSWSTSYRGPLAIHAAKGLGPVGGISGLRDLCCREPFFSALRTGGFDLNQIDVDQLPRGAIVAVCELTAIWPISVRGGQTCYCTRVDPRGGHNDYTAVLEPERSFGDYSPGRYAWLLANARALPEPVPAKGALGLWNPDTLTEMAITRQLIRGD